MNDPIGKAINDYYQGKHDAQILIQSTIAEDEYLPASYLFRSFDQMPFIEQTALQLCKGAVLDIGAGAGSHALYLQNQNKGVTALELSPIACVVMQQRGVKQVICNDIYAFTGKKYDTLLLLMNGTGIAGTPEGFEKLLQHLKTLLTPGGQLLIDSSDLIYLYTDEDGSVWYDINASTYYGQTRYELSYKGAKTAFDWLFLDEERLTGLSHKNGFRAEKVVDGNHYDYLYRLTR